jgi:hypothetical protein
VLWVWPRGSAVIVWWSDQMKGRKLPIILGNIVQLTALLLPSYMPNVGSVLAIVLCFIFGFFNASHFEKSNFENSTGRVSFSP